MENQFTTLRAEQDRLEERLAAVELNSAPRSAGPAEATGARVEHQPLKVVRLTPPDDSESQVLPAEPSAQAAPDSTARRPVIRGTGDRVIKVGDVDGADESRRDDVASRPVAELGKRTHGN